jgi:hypothetical protein
MARIKDNIMILNQMVLSGVRIAYRDHLGVLRTYIQLIGPTKAWKCCISTRAKSAHRLGLESVDFAAVSVILRLVENAEVTHSHIGGDDCPFGELRFRNTSVWLANFRVQ